MPARPLLVSILVATTALIHAEDPQMLRLHWQPGKTYTLEMVTETTSRRPDSGVNSQSMKVIQTTTLTVRKDGSTTDKLVEVKFAAMRGDISANGKTMTFDSSKPGDSDPNLQKAFGRAVGKTFVLVYDEQDRFRDVRELGSLASQPGSMTGLSAIADSRSVAVLFRKSLEIGLPPLPVSLGDTWTADEVMAFPSIGDTHAEMTGQLQSWEQREGRKQAKIAFDGKLASIVRKDKPANGIEIAKGSAMSGIILYDTERHAVSFAAYTTTLKLDMMGEITPFEQRITTKLVSVEDTK